MPLLLLLPLLVAGLFALWVLLLPLSILQRYRHGRARRRIQPWFVGANAWLLLLSALIFVAVAAALEPWIAHGPRDAAIGMAVGAGFGVLGLQVDRFEATAEGLFRTPNRWLVLGMAVLLAARVALGLWLAWNDGSQAGAAGWLTRGGLLGVGGVLLGYALATAWGLRARVTRRPPG